MTNLRVPQQRSDGRAQWQNPCDIKRLLSLLVIRAINMRGGDGEEGAMGSGGRGEGAQVEGVCKA